MRLILGTGLRDAICTAAVDAWPEECCGLLVGERTGGDAELRRIKAAPNVAEDKARRFEIDPAVLFATHRHVRETFETIIGHYHSHPNAAAVPSAHDRSRAFGEGDIWVIVKVDEGGADDLRAHLFRDGGFHEMEIIGPDKP